MFLRSLKIRNIRSIHSLDLSFRVEESGRQWTYLLGENGTGKSSILRTIALVMAGGEAIAELIGEPDAWIRLGENNAEIAVEFATAENEQRSASVNFSRGDGVRLFLQKNEQALGQIDAAVEKAERNYFLVGYGVSRRASIDKLSSLSTASPFRTLRAQSAATLFSGDASLVSLEQWAMDLEYRRGETGLQAVREAFNTLLPDVEFLGIDREKRLLLFKTPDGDLPLSALSDGYQAMAAWCGDLLFRITETFKDQSNPLHARGVLLIDELDLHLHPVWQRQLVFFLKKTLPNFQVVVTTHSPLTVHQASEGELFVLHRDKDKGISTQAFEGAPNRLLLHQLIQSPLFGLETLDSPQVAAMRNELRELQKIGTGSLPDDASKQKIDELTEQLADVPNWREVPTYLEQTNSVMEELARHLGTDPNDPNPLKTIAGQANRSLKRRR